MLSVFKGVLRLLQRTEFKRLITQGKVEHDLNQKSSNEGINMWSVLYLSKQDWWTIDWIDRLGRGKKIQED